MLYYLEERKIYINPLQIISVYDHVYDKELQTAIAFADNYTITIKQSKKELAENINKFLHENNFKVNFNKLINE